MPSKSVRRRHRGRYRKDSLKWAARLHNQPVKYDGRSGIACAVVMAGRGYIEVRSPAQDTIDRLAGREQAPSKRIEYRDRSKITFDKHDRIVSQHPNPLPPELEKMARFWDRTSVRKNEKKSKAGPQG